MVFFVALDAKTTAIVFYVDHRSDAGGFVGGARRATRNKPILVIKSGRSPAA
ncbi:hypothetical protein, partial [Enterobacter asburiae]